MATWQPIETAPTEVPILVWCLDPRPSIEACNVWTVLVEEDDGGFAMLHDSEQGYLSWHGIVPTHWMPLPDPPKPEGK